MLLDILYVQTIAPFWGYYGFINDPSHLCKILSWIILAAFIVIVFPYLKSDEEFSSDIALIIFENSPDGNWRFDPPGFFMSCQP